MKIPAPFSILFAIMVSFLNTNGSYTKNPAGTAAVPHLRNVFLDKSEVTNKMWHNYLRDLKQNKNDRDSYQQALPDTAIWKQAYPTSFFHSKTYDSYPVVGISYQQALAYCKWRSDYISDKEHRKIVYALPSYKIYSMISDRDPNEVADGLYSTDLGFRTFLGICDNADEMLATEGNAIQGSGRENCLDTIPYFVPTSHLGFRCLAKVN